MKKLTAFVLLMACVLGLVGCGSGKRGSLNEDVTDRYTFIVMDVTENNLLVAEIGENGKGIETRQYRVPNWFHPSTEIKEGYKITINHSGAIRETYPMQFAEIYSMEYHDKETWLITTMIPD